MAWDGAKWGQEGLFPANPDLANISDDMDFDFEKRISISSLCFGIPKNLDFSTSKIMDIPKYKNLDFPADIHPWWCYRYFL